MTAEDEKLLAYLADLRSNAAEEHRIELSCVLDDVIARIRELSDDVEQVDGLLFTAQKNLGEMRKEHAQTVARVEEERNAVMAERDRLTGEVEALRKFARDCRDGFDCDTGANGSHPLYCRACCAESALAQAGQTGGTQS